MGTKTNMTGISGRTFYLWKSTVYELFCNVCGRTLLTFEQVRNSIGYHLNVKIGATHAEISVGEDEQPIQCNEDIALMRTIPGMVVINPCDSVEAKAAVKAAYKKHNGRYIFVLDDYGNSGDQ